MSKKINRVAESREIERGRRALSLLKAFFTQVVVESVAKREFPQHPQTEVLKILDLYKADEEELVWRVRLGALRLSEGSLAKLCSVIEEAKQDFRDVLMLAEDPRLFKTGVMAYERFSEAERDRMADEDLEEYREWITSG